MDRWTIMYYASGAGGLNSSIEEDFQEIEAVGSGNGANFVCQYASRKPGEQAIRFRALPSGRDYQETVLGDAIPGNPEELVKFVQWVKGRFEAERYGLVLLGHGSGWQPEELKADFKRLGDSRGIEVDKREEDRFDRALDRLNAPEFRVLFLPTALELVAQAVRGRAVLLNDSSGLSLDTKELREVVESAGQILGKRLSFLGFDACLMACVEVGYELAEACEFIIASEQVEPGRGWPHTPICELFKKSGDAATREIVQKMPREYVNSYTIEPLGGLTMSVLAPGKMLGLARTVRILSESLLERWPSNLAPFLLAQHETVPPFSKDLWDLRSLLAALRKSESAAPTLKQACDLVNGSLEDAIVTSEWRGDRVKGVGGATIYVSSNQGTSPYYKDLGFASDSKWDEFLRTYKPPA